MVLIHINWRRRALYQLNSDDPGALCAAIIVDQVAALHQGPSPVLLLLGYRFGDKICYQHGLKGQQDR